MARRTAPATIVVYAPEEDSAFAVWRIVKTDERGDPAFLDSLRSNYDLGRPPRRREEHWSIVHMGISTFSDPRAAAGTARKWPVIGEWVAQIALTHGQGFNVAHTGMPGHLTLWGDPIKLLEAVVDIVAVGHDQP